MQSRKDVKIITQCFEPHKKQLDLVFSGFDKNYECAIARLPHKKKYKKKLTENQKLENKEVSSERIPVEHSIGGMKRFRILADRVRMPHFELFDNIQGTYAGLWNFYLNC